MTAPLAPLALPSDQDATGRTFGPEEEAAVVAALRTGTLTSTKGNFTRELECGFAGLLGTPHCHAIASGSAAMHAAVAALDPEPGDEFVTTPITDMGALTPILYQGAIPVFADVDPATGNVTAETLAARISPRTKALVATHLFGLPCEMDAIMQVAAKHNLPVVEDCAQAFLAKHRGRHVGTFGKLGAFSLQQGKHITTGEGGLVTSNDKDLARRVYLFLNKAWGYGDPKPDHYFIALNYRMCELQSAVALAQLKKLAGVVYDRQEAARKLTPMITGLKGVTPPEHASHLEPVWWKYAVMVDPAVIPGGAVALAGELKKFGVMSAPRYIQKPAFDCQIFREQRTFGNSRWPFTLARPEAVDYRKENFPGAYGYLERVLVLPWNERYEDRHLEYIAEALRRSVAALA